MRRLSVDRGGLDRPQEPHHRHERAAQVVRHRVGEALELGVALLELGDGALEIVPRPVGGLARGAQRPRQPERERQRAREAPDHPEQAAVALLRLQQVVGGARVVEAEERVPGEQHGERAVVRHARDLVANAIGGTRRLEGRADTQPVAARQHVRVQSTPTHSAGCSRSTASARRDSRKAAETSPVQSLTRASLPSGHCTSGGRREALTHHANVHRDRGDRDLFGEVGPGRSRPSRSTSTCWALHPGRADVERPPSLGQVRDQRPQVNGARCQAPNRGRPGPPSTRAECPPGARLRPRSRPTRPVGELPRTMHLVGRVVLVAND